MSHAAIRFITIRYQLEHSSHCEYSVSELNDLLWFYASSMIAGIYA